MTGTGLGIYRISPLAVPGAVNSGTLLVLYERFSDNPATCGACLIGSETFELPFQVTVNPVPEPATLSLAAAALLLGAFGLRRK